MNKRITVINDDLDFIDAIKTLLEELGKYNVNVIHEGEKAYHLVKADKPDLIILDIRMDAPNRGWEILDMLRLDPDTTSIPVIICTATILTDEKINWLKKHTIDVLYKPFDVDDLQRIVTVTLNPPSSISSKRATK